MLPKDTIISTARCVLRIPDESDFDMIFSASRVPGFNEGMQWDPPQSMEELKVPHENLLKGWESGTGYGFTIESTDDKEVRYGRISIRITKTVSKWNIGYWIHPNYQGKGLMTECVGAMVNFGFNTLAAHTISACVTTWNKASERVLLNNGFKFSHHIPHGIKKRGEWVAENEFVVTKT